MCIMDWYLGNCRTNLSSYNFFERLFLDKKMAMMPICEARDQEMLLFDNGSRTALPWKLD